MSFISNVDFVQDNLDATWKNKTGFYLVGSFELYLFCYLKNIKENAVAVFFWNSFIKIK